MAQKKKAPDVAKRKSSAKALAAKNPAKKRRGKRAKSTLASGRRSARSAGRIPEIELDDWSHFEVTIRRELGDRELVVRTFQRVVYDGIGTDDQVEVDLLGVVRNTGTDRRENAHMWNAAGFDHEHDRHPTRKKPHDIIYAFWVDFRTRPYKASRAQGNGAATMEAYDVTEDLTEHDAAIVYDPSRLKRVSPNEYWFLSKALDAAVLLLTVKE